jgi:23S rRNA pseudouridine2605 synthase
VSPRPAREVESVEGGVRLNKLLADHGLASRRGADEMIAEGHVFVDGVRVFELGLRVDPERQSIEIDGEPLLPKDSQRKQYYLLSKPPGVVCTNERRETRPRAIDLIKDRAKGRIYTVGRLDEESKGLIILTNDGEFAHRVMHPRYGVSKTYLVKLAGRISDEDVQRVRDGVRLADVRTAAARVLIKKRTRDYSQLEVTLQEGRNREIRRVFLAVGHKVVDLKRIRIGELSDRKLKIGYWRHLTPQEVRDLIALSEGEGREEEPLPEASPDAPRRRAGGARRRAARRGRRGR